LTVPPTDAKNLDVASFLSVAAGYEANESWLNEERIK